MVALPCPFCGSTDPPIYYGAHIGQRSDKYGGAECGACDARGPSVRTGYEPLDKWRDAAINAWNERAK